MEIIGYSILCIYVFSLTYIAIYCLMQFNLLFYYKRHHFRNSTTKQIEALAKSELPFVTIQLPIYNEMYVVNRLIDNITKLDYPKERYEIHVIDDSTDETLEIAKKKVAEYTRKGYNIQHITRSNREGYKAGALKEAMQYVKGEFIAIFDADFLPKTSFLQDTLPYFENKKIGVVQTRWEHLNQNYSLLTKLQAFQLNVHFTVEQLGRQAGNLMLQFNGTAGVWRKETIVSAGGWEADTLTEDLDLSYRAQLKGWEIIFLEQVGSPAELPSEMNGLKSQQFRWMKGGAETAKKILPSIWRSDLTAWQKVHASLHLLSSTVFLFVFLIGVFSVPLLFFLSELDLNSSWFGIFFISTLAIVAVYYVANMAVNWEEDSKLKAIFKFIVLFPVFLSLSMGLSLHNSIAVIQGYIGRKSSFVRTPKFDIQKLSDTFKNHKYLKSSISKITIMEGFLAVYFGIGLIAGAYYQAWTFWIFHLLLAIGYGTIFYFSVRHAQYTNV